MKVSIIGGGGLVGSSAAFALQCGGIVSQIDLIDANADQVAGAGARPAPRGLARRRPADPRRRLRGDPRERRRRDHRRPAAQAGREPARPDQPQRRAVPEHPRPGQASAGLKKRRDRPRRLQPGRCPDVSRRQPARAAVEPGHRPGYRARHGPLPQPDRRGAQACRRRRSRP